MVDTKDLFKQQKVYHRNGKWRWAVFAYCPTPSLTMVDLGTGTKVCFGIEGSINTEFEPTGEVCAHEDVARAKDMKR